MHFFMRKFRTRMNFFQKSEKKKKEQHYWKNGGALLTDLITTFGPRYKIPIRHFGAEEILSATNGFREMVDIGDYDGRMYSGFLEGRPILVKKYNYHAILENLIRDVTINSQMSHHKNVLKLLGCCLEFGHPALIYDFCGTDLLSDILQLHDESNCRRSLSWTSRLRIASEIASVIAYLHNAFPTPIIFRDIKPKNVIIDQHGVAKLFSFSLSISLPPGKLQVEDIVRGTFGYLDPAYSLSGNVTQKTDVYSFGMLLLQLLTGRRVVNPIDSSSIFKFLIYCVDTAELDGLVDPKILGEGGGVEQMEQIQAYLHLALHCVLLDQEDRPFIIDVAKQLRKIERYPQQLPPLGSTWNTICSLIRAVNPNSLYSLHSVPSPALSV